MATATVLPKRSEVRVEDTWNLETIYPPTRRGRPISSGSRPCWRAFAPCRARSVTPRRRSSRRSSDATPLARFWGGSLSIAYMRLHQDTTDNTYQAMADRVTTLANEFNAAASYLTPEILAIPQERLDAFLQRSRSWRSIATRWMRSPASARICSRRRSRRCWRRRRDGQRRRAHL